MPESYTAGQYVIIAENDRKKKALSTLKGKYDALLQAHRDLQEEREAEKKESYEVACARPSRRAMARTIVWREVGCCRRCIRPRRRRWRAGCSRLTERTRCVCST